MTLVPLRRNRDFVLLQVGQTLSTIGSEATAIAYPLLVLAVTHSPAKAGIVGFARVVPWALFGFAAGVVADRLNRKRIMVVSDVVRIAAVSSLLVAFALDRISVLQVALVAFVEGSMYVFFNVAELGALRSVVPARQLPAAAAAEQARYSIVFLVAPPLGGALFGISRVLPFVADVDLVLLLARVAARDANAVPGDAQRGADGNARGARGGRPLAVGSPLLPRLRAALLVDEPRLRGAVPRS